VSRYTPPGAMRVGPLMVWPNRQKNGLNAAISIHWRGSRLVWVRFGRGGFRLLDERYPEIFPDTSPWRYYIGERVSVKWGNT